MVHLKEQFLLDPNIVFLNHGSFGAAPRPVFEAYQAWQRELERQPVRFLMRDLPDRLQEARQELARYLGTAHENLVFVPNATFGVNLVARALALEPGDQVLTTDHEYGACDRTWAFICARSGAEVVRQAIPLPAESPRQLLEALWSGVTGRTRVIFVSHITSPTALCLPVEALCRRARQAGILTVIDGAHAPGQIDLDLTELGADFYTGNCHKWLMAPKGAGFLHVKPDRQGMVRPLVVSWGWQGEGSVANSTLPEVFEWTGTRDPAAYLAVPASIRFLAEHDWPAVRHRCHRLVSQALDRVCQLTGLEPPYPDRAGLYHQMATLPLPHVDDLPALQAQLYDAYRIEIPGIEWNGRHFLRISVQGYNAQGDIDALLDALQVLL